MSATFTARFITSPRQLEEETARCRVFERHIEDVLHLPRHCLASWCNPPVHLTQALFPRNGASQRNAPHPARSPDGRVHVAGSVRLDNFDELKRRLSADEPSVSDLELTARAYSQWGPDRFLEQIWGDFAFALWDEATQSLYCCRDRLGLRHLYYTVDTWQAVFSSSLLPLVHLVCDRLALNRRYLSYFLAHVKKPIWTSDSPLEGINQVRPAHCLRFDRDGVEESRYWRPERLSPFRNGSKSEFEPQARAALKNAVRARMRAHGPIWCDLSGGVDSTSVALLAKEVVEENGGRLEDSLKLYSVILSDRPDYSEYPYMEAAQQALRLSTTYELPDGSINFVKAWEESSPLHWDEPTHAYFSVPEFLSLSGHIRESGAEARLLGHGGDHLFHPCDFRYIRRLLTRGLRKCFDDFRAWSTAYREPFFPFLLRQVLFPKSSNRIAACPVWLDPSPAAQAARTYAVEQKRWKPRLGDPFAQAHFDYIMGAAVHASPLPLGLLIDERFPYLDARLAELALRIPLEVKMQPPLPKSLLRDAMRGTLPELIRQRGEQPNLAGVETSKLRSSRREIESILEHSRLAQQDLVDAKRLQAEFDFFLQGRLKSFLHFMAVIGTEMWLRGIDRLPRPTAPAHAARAQT